MPELICREGDQRGLRQFAEAIMTTDTVRRWLPRQLRSGKRTFTLPGVAKGAGMIHPQLATMLVYLFTDVAAGARELQALLKEACDDTFNCISVDGDTSTNDTVLVLASSASTVSLRTPGVRAKFTQALNEVCREIALQIIRDGEGVKHVVRLRIEQARNRREAMQIARTIAHSPLVKTAWAGADPNWGRILAAAGRAGISLDPRRINIFCGDQQLCRGGVAAPFDEQPGPRLSHPARVRYSRAAWPGAGFARLPHLRPDHRLRPHQRGLHDLGVRSQESGVRTPWRIPIT